MKRQLSVEKNAKLRFRAKSALFAQDLNSAQSAYSQPSMSICAEIKPERKSSNLVSKASFAFFSIVLLVLLCSCFSRSSYITADRFENIQIGTPIDTLKSEIGSPYAIHSKGGNVEEYEYIERIDMGGRTVSENRYYLIVTDGKVTGKYVKNERSPAFDMIYEESPIPDGH